ncbi:hypothetical protein FH972_023293 [Carpinus fangiana]|uniref:Uncharacterized protein n=1 Tax=Carpinus fangiana TaxID=176857 RepID=A0A5N6KVE0_9ROSI|nr:hypothetical protein FH972_023293 [Carpinus fangiana]
MAAPSRTLLAGNDAPPLLVNSPHAFTTARSTAGHLPFFQTMSDAAAEPSGESAAQKQARLRRERRNAKLQAGGSDRLNKITSLSGRPAAAEAFATPSPSASPQPTSNATGFNPLQHNDADPEEVDITTMFQRPGLHDPTGADQQALLQQLLRGGPSGAGPPNHRLDGATPDEQAAMNDPMMQMMQQMMGGGPGMGGPPGADGLPPGLASMFGQGFGAQQQQQQQQAPRPDYAWRIAHALFAVILAVYVATWTTTPNQPQSVFTRPFWIFTTAELILQSTRYFVDGGKLPPGGLLSTVAGFLPQPYAGYIQTASRYSLIYSTIVSDAMVVIFVLGARAWWTGWDTAIIHNLQ